jgi:hypothetical protein
MNIEAVVLYTTNDYRFFKVAIENLLACGIKTHVVTYSHMWNGTDENEELLNHSRNLFKDNPNYFQYLINWEPGHKSFYWEAVGRHLGTQEVSDECDYILYIDIDEIVDVEKCKKFIASKKYANYDCAWLYNYWYFREPIYRANALESTALMCSSKLAKNVPFIIESRNAYSNFTNTTILGKEDPFVHHYSWVRTKEEMLKKVRNWGHNTERNWEAMVEQEFTHPFYGTDFVHGYSYQIVENQFNL